MRRASLALAALIAGLVLSPLPAQATTPKFQIRCLPSHVAQEDPIAAPGIISAHMHQFFGNRTTNKDSTYASMIGQPTTCSTPDDTAGYWVPTLLDGANTIAPISLLIYYRFPNGADTVAFPPDLRMVSHDFVVSANNIDIKFPSCWDGVNTDSPDHISHMAYFARGQTCPVTHPVNVPAITEIVRYAKGVDVSTKTLSSGELSTMHADFWNTWNQDALVALVARCNSIQCGRIDG